MILLFLIKFDLALCVSKAGGIAYEKISGVPFGMRARRISDIFEMAAEIGCRNFVF